MLEQGYKTNSRFAKFIYEKGTYLGSGCARTAYDYDGKVYKIPYDSNEQGEFEQDILSMLPEEYQVFFPNPKFFGRIVQMDYVVVADEARGSLDEDYYDEYGASDEALYDFIEIHKVKCDMDLLDGLLDWIEDQGGAICDILTNSGNFGYCPITKQLKIVDWGWSSHSW